MNATLKNRNENGTIPSGTFYKQQLDFGEVAFSIVTFTPQHHGKEVLVRVASPDGDMLFNAKEHRTKGLIFLKALEETWCIYRVIGTKRDRFVDELWLVTAEGVEHAGAKAFHLKQLAAAQEHCRVAFTQAEVEGEEKRTRDEAVKRFRREQDEERGKKLRSAVARDERKRKLRSSTVTFVHHSGKIWNGFPVRNEDEARMLENGDRAVFVRGGRVVRALFVTKSKGGRVRLEELTLINRDGAGEQSKSGTKPAPAVRLQKFGAFRRVKEKRGDGRADVVAYLVSDDERKALSDNRPEEPVKLAIPMDDGRFHLYEISQEGVDDLGVMERVIANTDEAAKRFKAV